MGCCCLKVRIENPALLLVVLVVVAGLVYFIQSMKPAVQDSPGPVGLEGEMDDLLYPRAPELAGIAGYVNVEQGFTLESVKGKVVLVDFWTYSCINCIRTLPYLTAWHEKYKDKGLVIVGVHTPEFEFEKDPENVKRAVEKHGIEYVVVQDNDYATWRAYRNRFWPHKYLVDAEGFVRYDHIGEGAYDETEDVIRKLLMERDESIMAELPEAGVEVPAPDFSKILTPELYFGHAFQRRLLGSPEGYQPGQSVEYSTPGELENDKIYLTGKWMNNAENMELVSGNGSVSLKYNAREVNLVAGVNGTLESTLELYLDGAPLGESMRGSDVVAVDGKALVKVKDQKLYNLVKGAGYDENSLEIRVVGAGLKAYTFTFG